MDLTHKENESNEAEERITQFINKNIELIRKNKKLEEENNKLKSIQINNEKIIAKLREENEQLKANFNSVINIEKKIKEIELEDKIINYKEIINILNIDLSYINNKSSDLEERIAGFVKANIELIKNNKKLKSTLDNIEKENQVKLEEKDNKIKILTDENAKLKKEIQFAENKNKHFNNLIIENDNLKKENEELSKRLLLEEEKNKNIINQIKRESAAQLENTIQSIKKLCKDKINEINNNAKKRFKELENIVFALYN